MGAHIRNIFNITKYQCCKDITERSKKLGLVILFYLLNLRESEVSY